jgi:hypothetical protein
MNFDTLGGAFVSIFQIMTLEVKLALCAMSSFGAGLPKRAMHTVSTSLVPQRQF